MTQAFEIVLRDGAVEMLDGVDTYQQEGPMTTFFRTGDGRSVIDVWSTRIASFRTADLVAIRRQDDHGSCGEHVRTGAPTLVATISA